ncbi:MAG TPA: SiaC family regulatory phosphoprotein [Rectinemataceae bacterium]|nr:SiaC family regulatory phosphoprotein [Rectinemataceae bacterium]
MKDLLIAATKSSPSVRLESATGIAELAGESYPENAFEFYAPILAWIRDFISAGEARFRLEIRLSYLNTSSTKCLIDLLDELEAAHRAGHRVEVAWHCDADNERCVESAEEFKEDVSLPFDILLDGAAE